ncbi:MAG: cyclic nucleotide-binding domain-containing protein [Nitrospinales bacterium]
MVSSTGKRRLSPEKIIALFYKIPFFNSFNADEKKKFVNIDTSIIDFNKNDCLIREGAMDNALYILLKGTAYITKDITPSLKIAILKPGALFGEISFLAKSPRSTNVIAATDVTVLKLNRVILARLGSQLEIKVRNKLMKILISRLDNINRILIDYVRFMPEEERKHLR